MKIQIDTLMHTVRTNTDELIEFDRYYPLDDEHRFIVRRVLAGQRHIAEIIEIRRGKKVVQRSTLRHLSTTAGQKSTGDQQMQVYVVHLDPKLPIFPIEELVNRLISLGIYDWQISPMFNQGDLDDCVASLSGPVMWTNGDVYRTELPSEGDLAERSLFEVRGATWAIRGFAGRVSRVYLWMNAADDADKIVQTIQDIKSGVRVEAQYAA